MDKGCIYGFFFFICALHGRELHSYESYLGVIPSDNNYENKLFKKYCDLAAYNSTHKELAPQRGSGMS
jgi:hypothetical protein